MWFILELEFSGDPRRLDARAAHRVQLERLHEQGRLVLAGPWKDDSGAALIFNTDRDGAQEILAADPYYSSPGVRVVSLRGWNPIVGVQHVSS
jgi:uncharacterized protein YciI